jgi:1-acyl-sn-glycerol-3-phosphate acyltransferase
VQRFPAGLILVVAGGVLIVVGLLAWSGALSWFGRLPGDIRVERENARVYVPITSMLLLSVVVSVVVALVRRLWS